jgi:hypothetical protein
MPTPGTASETVVFGVRRRLTSAERRIRKVKFRVASAIVMYGFMPLAITPLAGIVRLVHGINPQGFEPSNPLPSNPAYFMDPAGHKFLYGLAGGLDIFALWTVVLLGIGFACQSRMKRSTAIMIVLGWYVMLRLMVAGLAALFLL